MNSSADDLPTAYEGWAIVELMGHRLLAGRVAEIEQYGGKQLQLNIHGLTGDRPGATQFYGVSAIYCLTPCTEQVARAIGARKLANDEVMPVVAWELDQPLPALESGDLRDPRDNPDFYEREPPV